MQTHRTHFFSCIRTEGAILPADLLQRIAAGDGSLPGLKPTDYHLAAGEKINEAVNRSWNRLLGCWTAFRAALEKLPLSDLATTATRERWLLPLFQELGYGRLPVSRSAIAIEEREYPISHLYRNVPIHLTSARLDLDRRTPGVTGAARSSPHSLLQEFLNRSQTYLWGFLSNGLRLRVLRDNRSLTRQAYVEFDLEAMMDSEAYSDFAVLWLLCHESRIEAERPEQCILETWSQTAQKTGARALEELRKGVEEAIKALGAGFVAHPANVALRESLRSGSLDKQDYYRQLLRLVYRLLFLFVAEDRDLLLVPTASPQARNRYNRHYSTLRLRTLAQRTRGTPHTDLWETLRLIMAQLHSTGCPELGLPALGSTLWNPAFVQSLTPCHLSNTHLLSAIKSLAFIVDSQALRPVDFKNLRSEELGSVYESLLELHPAINSNASTFDLQVAAGNERKTTGSYYTPDSLVQCLLDSALEPVMDDKEALARKVEQKIETGRVGRSEWFPEELDLIIPRGQDPEEALASRMVQLLVMQPAERNRTLREAAILSLRVCDPACGSGHFLIAAAHRMARRLAAIRTGDEEPSPEATRHALRDVVGHCLYGVDINPMAVELAKVALWMEAIEPGKPLSFLEAHFQCGNSLLGATPELIAGGIPDGAFTVLTGDNKAFVSALKKRNKQERDHAQREFFTVSGAAIPADVMEDLSKEARALFEANADSLADVQRIAANYEEFRRSPAFRRSRFVADLWCAAFVWPKVDADEWAERVADAEAKSLPLPGPRDYPEPPTHDLIQRCAQHPEPWKPLSDAQRDMLDRLVSQFRFIQWHVLFADVFRPTAEGENLAGGFGCMLGNPPWERVKIQEKEFFAQRCPSVANAASASERESMIDELRQADPLLFLEFQEAQRIADGSSILVRETGRYPQTGRGDVNTYAIFAELFCESISATGRSAVILQSGIATDATYGSFFKHLISTSRLVSFYDFENKGIFADVHSSFKIGAMVVTGAARPISKPWMVFFAHSVEETQETNRRFTLNASDFDLLNPESGTCPIFRSSADAELNKQLYRRHESFKNSAWKPEFFKKMVDFGIHKAKIKFLAEADQSGLMGLYEAKFVHLYNHRYATYQGVDADGRGKGNARELTDYERLDPALVVESRAYVTPEFFLDRMAGRAWDKNWLLSFRDKARSTDERTAIFAVRPYQPSSDTLPSLFFSPPGKEIAVLPACVSSYAFDYLVRQKVGAINVGAYILEQIPVIEPFQSLGGRLEDFAKPRVLELSFTVWDLEPFARDCGYDGPPFIWDEERRLQIRAELDAAFFHLYLGAPEEWTRTGSPELRESFPTPRHAVDYIMESFPIVKKKDEKQFGEFRTKRVILEIYDAMAEAIQTGVPYQTCLNPPPGPPVDEAGEFLPLVLLDANSWPSNLHLPKRPWSERLVDAWKRLLERRRDIVDIQDFPHDGRESFVYAFIPYLVQSDPGQRFEFYRDAALLAARPGRFESLLLRPDLREEFRKALSNAGAWFDFSDEEKARTRDIRRSLQETGIVVTDSDSGVTTLADPDILPPLPNSLAPLVRLSLLAGENLVKYQQRALSELEMAEIGPAANATVGESQDSRVA